MSRLLILLLLHTSCLLPSAWAKPNVVIFFTDDQGTLDANCYGSSDLYTPAMDQLAATGIRFTQAYSHVVCCPARALLMTGRHPQRSGVVHWTQGDRHGTDARNTNMAAAEVTIAEALKGAGYKTAIFGKWHLGAKEGHGPLAQGFDHHFGHLGGFIDNYNHFFLHGSGFHDLYEDNKEVFKRDEYFPDLMTKRALDYIEANKEGPFFIYVAFNIPHYPEQPDKKFEERYQDLKMPRRSYAKMISTTDDRMLQILKKLEALDLRKETIVIFMSDNGHSTEDGAKIRPNHKSGLPEGHYYHANGGGGNTGKFRGNKGTYFEGGLRVPAIISYPAKLPKGEVRDQAITAADWYPTILELCGVEKPKVKLDGHSVLPLIRDASTPSLHRQLHWAWSKGWAMREGDWKLIGNGAKPNFLGNLTDEEPEKKNYLKEMPDLVAKLHQLHKEWAKSTAPTTK
ncbi:MAG: sulfatase-like hydrolase/transferase [Roseibacillus sp.]|jgi:arylsulfatase A-like enzyme